MAFAITYLFCVFLNGSIIFTFHSCSLLAKLVRNERVHLIDDRTFPDVIVLVKPIQGREKGTITFVDKKGGIFMSVVGVAGSMAPSHGAGPGSTLLTRLKRYW